MPLPITTYLRFATLTQMLCTYKDIDGLVKESFYIDKIEDDSSDFTTQAIYFMREIVMIIGWK